MSTLLKALVTGLLISCIVWLIIFTLDYMPTLSHTDQLLWSAMSITATIGCFICTVGINSKG